MAEPSVQELCGRSGARIGPHRAAQTRVLSGDIDLRHAAFIGIVVLSLVSSVFVTAAQVELVR
jgi:hypothetical protein